MFDWFKDLFSCIAKDPVVEGAGPRPGRYTSAEEKGKAKLEYDSAEDELDPCMWSRHLDEHAYGEFSIAAAQANDQMEDRSQVEAGRNATAVGVYDGHGGPEASHYLCENLFNNILREALKGLSITEEVLSTAIKGTEVNYLAHVGIEFVREPRMAATGSCCVVGVIWNGRLYVANLGDSRAVVGCLRAKNGIRAVQLTDDHNASKKDIRKELRKNHPYDRNIVVKRDGRYRIKGKIEISRAIGDAYLKDPIYAIDAIPKFRLTVPIQPQRPVISDVPQIISREIGQTDMFYIFATDGLWDHLTNQQAVEIVHKYPRKGIARRLLRAALTVAIRKGKGGYSLLRTIEKGARRHIHDDTSVVVLFIDHTKLNQFNSNPGYSIRAFRDYTPPSEFNIEAAAVELE